MKSNKKIILAKHAGFCFGVRRAVEIAEKELKNKRCIYCLGDLVHNPCVVKKLESEGLKICKKIEGIPAKSFLLVRSHGLDERIIKKAKDSGMKIIDATCPFVKNAQKAAENFYKNKFQVVIIGDSAHPEIVAINSYTKDSAIIVKNEKEARKLKYISKCGLLIQTTKDIGLLKKVSEEMLNHTKTLCISNTVCSNSFTKKEELKKMSKNVDIIIVIGGKKSNNTKELVEVGKNMKVKTFHIENASELKKEWFKNVKKIGLTAGASTPDISIKETVGKIKEYL